MPTYELTCKDCGERFDLFVMRLLRDEDKICPSCGSREVRTGFGGGYVKTAVSVSSSCGDRGFT